MKMSASNGSKNEYRNLALDQLQESLTNPRKRFDEKTLAELAASIKTQGLLEPLLVRELETNKYEIVVGARRFRAVKAAKLTSVPVRVVNLTDAQAIEAQVVENLQREDIHPLEEALEWVSLKLTHYLFFNALAFFHSCTLYFLRRRSISMMNPAT
jgi:ParB/RepB/Spo0J family partition protein